MHSKDRFQGSITNNKSTVAVVAAMFAMLLLPAIMVSTAVPADAQSSKLKTADFQLDITPIAPRLPADASTYYAMIQLQTANDDKPIAAPYDLGVVVISSDPSVLQVAQENVVMKKGEFMTKAEFITTKKAGEVSISAQAESVESSSVTINTISLDSQEPTKLAMYAAAGSFVPDSKIPGMLYIQLLNSQNVPSITKNQITVTLSSSNSEIGTVPSYVTIPGGQSGVALEFAPGQDIGTTTISASSQGFIPAKLDVKIDGPVGTKLVVEFGPPTTLDGANSIATIQLRDSKDLPIKAAKPIIVSLKASDTSIISVPTTAQIPEGKSYVSVIVKSRSVIGSAIVTASATGYESGISTITIVDGSESSSQDDMRINLYSVPSKLLPDNSEHQAIIIQFTDQSGKIMNPSSNFHYSRITFSTSDTKIGSIVNSALIQRTGYALATFKTTHESGETIITASGSNLAPAQITLEVAGSSPAALKLTQIPGFVQALKNAENNNLAVSLVDSTGRPVVALKETIVFFTSSSPSIASVQASVVIPAGTSYVVARTQTTDKAGETTITATASDLASADIRFKTIGFAGSISQYALGLYTVPKISADNQSHEAIFIQLQDQTGTPTPARTDIPVTLSSSSFSAGTVQSEVTIPRGKTFVIAQYTTSSSADDDVKITASSPGFGSVEAGMDTTVQPLSVKILNAVPRQGSFEDGEIFLQVEVTSFTLPVEGATIEVGGPQSSPTYSVTDENGYADGTYISARPGANTIEVKAIKPGYEQTIAKASSTLSQTVDIVVRAVSEGGTDIPAQFKIAAATTAIKNYNSLAEKPVTFNNAKWGTYRITAPEEFTNSAGEFKFVSWSDGKTDNPRSFDVVEDTEIKAVYSAQFMLQATSAYGATIGTGLYNEGEIATISLGTTSISEGLIDKNFAGWSGDIRSDAQTTQVKMDGPKVITAQWQDSYLKLAILGAAIAGGGVMAYIKVLKPRRKLAEKARAPDLDWYKS
jgi:hypothetical protein